MKTLITEAYDKALKEEGKNMSKYITEIGESAKKASFTVRNLTTDIKNRILMECADNLKSNVDMILDANKRMWKQPERTDSVRP